MAKRPKPNLLYCAAYELEKENSTIQGVALSSSLEDVRRAIDTGALHEPEPDAVAADHDLEAEDELALDLEHFFNAMRKYYELSYIYISRPIQSF